MRPTSRLFNMVVVVEMYRGFVRGVGLLRGRFRYGELYTR